MSASLTGVEPDLGHPFQRYFPPFIPGHAPAFQAKGHIIHHGPVVKTGVVLKDHAPVRPRAHHGPAVDQHLALGLGKLRGQPGYQAKNGALAAAAGPQHGYEFTHVSQIFHQEVHIADGGKGLAGPRGIGLGNPR